MESNRQGVLSVGAAIALAQDRLDELGPLVIAGEIFDYRGAHPSGHHYFSLQDKEAKLSAILWRGNTARALRCPLEEGRAVLLHGKFDIWEKNGRLSFQVSRVEDRGEGDLARRFEALKQRFLAEGLFDVERKQPLPGRPRRIALVTAHPSAASADFLQTLEERNSPIQVLLCAAPVQGEAAAVALAEILEQLPPLRLDVVVLSRGGGSLEDLWAFNEEVLVRAVANCPLPTINAVGHETDTTLCDFAADFRCKTPTAAAAHLAEGWLEAERSCRALGQRLESSALQLLEGTRSHLRLMHRDLRENRPERRLERMRSHLLHLQSQLAEACSRRLELARVRLVALEARFRAVSPLGLLDRGWALVEVPGREGYLRDAEDVAAGDFLRIRLARGNVGARVEETGLNGPSEGQ